MINLMCQGVSKKRGPSVRSGLNNHSEVELVTNNKFLNACTLIVRNTNHVDAITKIGC